MRLFRLGVATLAACLGGCAVGPDFSAPATVAGAGYIRGEPTTAGTSIAVGTQQLNYGADVQARWWELFRNARLDGLMREAVGANPDLAAARAALRQANELALAEAGTLYPAAEASAAGERGRASGTGSEATGLYDLASASVTLDIPVDVFGRDRRTVEAAQAGAESQAFEAEATYLTLTAGLATASIQEASLREQIAATQEIVGSLQELLDVLNLQVDVGIASRSNVLQQQAALLQAQATLPGLVKRWEQQRNAIATLAGRFPNDYDQAPFTLADLTLPHELPVSLPSALLRQRPDVRSAEALVHQASANVGVATADMLPQFTLTASAGRAAAEFGNLFDAGALIWSAAAGVTQPIFQGGQLEHNKRAAQAALEQSLATYRSVVLGAFQDVADTLRAVERDTEALAAYREAERAARDSLELARLEFTTGTGAYTDVLTAQQTYQEARISRAAAEADRYLDAVGLFQALGGGWWNRARPLNATPPATTPNLTTANGSKT